jgi:hypothetical protein
MDYSEYVSSEEKRKVFKFFTAVPLTARIIKCREKDVCIVLKERIQ